MAGIVSRVAWSADAKPDTMQTEINKALTDVAGTVTSANTSIATLISSLLAFPSIYGAGEFSFRSNSFGSCLDFADGNKTRIQWGTDSTLRTTSTGAGAVFQSSQWNFTFPFSFSGALPSMGFSVSSQVAFYSWVAMNSLGLTGGSAYLVSPVNTAQGVITWFAIGTRP